MENGNETEQIEEEHKPEYHEFDEGLETVKSRSSHKYFDHYLIDDEPTDFEIPKYEEGLSLGGLTFQTFQPEELEAELEHIPDMQKPEYDPRRYFSYKFKRSPPASPPKDRGLTQKRFEELFAAGEPFSCIDETAGNDLSFDTRYPNYFGSDFNYLKFPAQEKVSPPRQPSHNTFVLKKRENEIPPWRERAEKEEANSLATVEQNNVEKPASDDKYPEVSEPLNLSEDDNVVSNWDDNLSEDNVAAQLEILSPHAQQEKLFEEQRKTPFSIPSQTQSDDQFDAYWEVQPENSYKSLFQVQSEPQIRVQSEYQPKSPSLGPEILSATQWRDQFGAQSQVQCEAPSQVQSGSQSQGHSDTQSQPQSRIPSSEQIPTNTESSIDNDIDSLFAPEYQYLYDLADEYNETMEILRNLTLDMALNNPNPLSKYKTYEEYLEGEEKFQKDCAEHFKRETEAQQRELKKKNRSKTNLHVYFDTNVTKWSNPSSVVSEASEDSTTLLPFSYQDCEQGFIGPKPQYWIEFNSLDEIGKPVAAFDAGEPSAQQKNLQPIWIDPDVDFTAPITYDHDYNLILDIDSVEELLCLESIVAEEGRVCKIKVRNFPPGMEVRKRDEKKNGNRDEKQDDKGDDVERLHERIDDEQDEKQNEEQDERSSVQPNAPEMQELVEEKEEVTPNVAFNPQNFPFLTLPSPGDPKPEVSQDDTAQKISTEDLSQDLSEGDPDNSVETYASKLKKAKSAPGVIEARPSTSFVRLPYVRSSQPNIRSPCKYQSRPPGNEKHIRRVFWRSDVKSYEKEKIEQEEVRSAEKKLAGENTIASTSSPGAKKGLFREPKEKESKDPKDKEPKDKESATKKASLKEPKESKDFKDKEPVVKKGTFKEATDKDPLVKKGSFKESKDPKEPKDQEQIPKSPEKVLSRPAFEKKTKSQTPITAKQSESSSSNVGGKKAKQVSTEPWVSVKKRGSKSPKDSNDSIKSKTNNKPAMPTIRKDEVPKKE